MLQTLSAYAATIGTLLVIFLKVGVVIGGTGTLIETVGKWRKWTKWIVFGQKLEAIGADIPKLVEKIEKQLPPGLVGNISMMLVVSIVMLIITALPGCSKVNWPAVMQCGAPLAQAELTAVSTALAGDGDVESALADIAKQYGPSTVECAVQEIVSDLAAKKAAGDQKAIHRGRAFLAEHVK